MRSNHAHGRAIARKLGIGRQQHKRFAEALRHQQTVEGIAVVVVQRQGGNDQDVSLWEMAVKISTGKLDIDLPRFVEKAEGSGFEWLDIKTEHCTERAVMSGVPPF